MSDQPDPNAPVPPAPEAVDEEHAKQLASLGYLTMTSAPTGTLPDPKDEIATLEMLKKGLGLAKGGHAPESVAVLKELLQRNPRIVDAWEAYAQGLARLGRADEGHRAVSLQQVEVAVQVVCGRHRVEDEVEAAQVLLHLGGPAGDDDLVSAEPDRVVRLRRRGGEDDHARPEGGGELDAHVPEPAEADDADLLAGANVPVPQR